MHRNKNAYNFSPFRSHIGSTDDLLFIQNSIQKFTIKLRHYGIKVRNPPNQDDELRPLCSTLTAIPRFIRFDNVEFNYNYSNFNGEEPIKLAEDVSKSFRPFLQLLRGHNSAIENSSLSLEATIQSDANDPYSWVFCFPSHQKVLEYLSNELLPTFHSCRRYKFGIAFWKDKNHAKNVIVSLLGLPAVERCSNVAITFEAAGDDFPAEAISHWLNLSQPNAGEGKERFLSIAIGYVAPMIPKFEEVVEHLKKVNYIYFNLLN